MGGSQLNPAHGAIILGGVRLLGRQTAPIADIAYTNKQVIYDLLFKAAANPAHHCG